MKRHRWFPFILALWMGLVAVACSPTVTPTLVEVAPTETANVVIVVITNTPPPTITPRYTAPTRTPTLTPTPLPDTLTICNGAEPETLYLYGGSMLDMSNILEAVYDGPIDSNDYGYQPIILEKLPSLADGDASLEAVTVQEGDLIVDADGNVATLTAGVRVRPAGCRAPECAVAFEGGALQMDQLSASFTLLPDLRWSDGALLTAHDSVYSFELAADPGTPGSEYFLKGTESYVALDARTTQWIGLPGYLDPTYFTNYFHPLPQHLWGEYSAQELLDLEISRQLPVGWGPYIIEEWKTGSYIQMRRNPYYFRADEGLPAFEFIVFRFLGENSLAGLANLLNGECDVLTQTTHIDDRMDVFRDLDTIGELQLIASPGTVWEHADFGIRPAAYDDGYTGADRPDFFGDPRTRQAIAACIDRTALVDALLLGLSEVIHSYIPDSHPLFNAAAPQYPYNPDAGMALLDEIGWGDHDADPATPRVAAGVAGIPDGTPLSFNYATTDATQRQQASQIIADSLAQCGIEIKLEYSKPDDFFADGPEGPVFGRRFDMAQFAWLSGVTPPCDLYMTDNIAGPPELPNPAGGWTGPNNSGYSNPAFDAACRLALSFLPGEPGYEEAHRQAQAIFAADLPVIPLYLRLKLAAARAGFCGYALNPTADSDLWNLEAFHYGSDCGR